MLSASARSTAIWCGPMHGANEAAPIDKLLEALKIYIIALLRLEEIDF